jgi:hypothetical protein
VKIGWLGIQLILSNSGSCFLQSRMPRSLILAGRLHQVHKAPEFLHPSYMVFPREADSEVMQQAIEGLLKLAHEEQNAG